MTQAIAFSEQLAAQIETMQGQPKREKTRAKILAATAKQLEKVGYDALTVDDIIHEVGMARGTFYIYFESRSFAVEAVMMAYFKALADNRPKVTSPDPFDAIMEFNRYYVANYERNSALAACIEPLCREREEISQLRQQSNHDWCQSVVRDLEKRCGDAALQTPAAVKTLLIWSMSSLVDELLREMFINKSPHLVHLTDNTDQVAELISLVWFRALYAQDVPPEKLQWAQSLSNVRLLQ